MMALQLKKAKGFTLLEIMLVIAIASSLLVLMLSYTTQKADQMRRDKTVLQMQQILNAGMSFYTANSYWPLKNATISDTKCGTNTWTDITALTTGGNYAAPNLVNNSYGNPYNINCTAVAQGGGFYIHAIVNTPANAAVIAGRLPMAYITTPASLTGAMPPAQASGCSTAPFTGCTVVIASVSIPGQNLNNARSINFAGIYNNGACVPAPNCPPNMSPAIYVTPASVSGIAQKTQDNAQCSTPGDPTTCTSIQAYPVTSFTAFARGVDSTNAPAPSTGSGSSIQATPLDCAVTGTPAAQDCNTPPASALPATEAAGTRYWRVCLVVATQFGQAYPNGTNTNSYSMGKLTGNILAVTRCVPHLGDESPSGSAMTVWTPNVGWQK